MYNNTDIIAEEYPLPEALSSERDEPTFGSLWQARVFAISLALTEEDIYTWDQFNAEFIGAIQTAEDAMSEGNTEAVYHRKWMESVEQLLETTGTVTQAEIDKRQSEFEAGQREESEFTVTHLPEAKED